MPFHRAGRRERAVSHRTTGLTTLTVDRHVNETDIIRICAERGLAIRAVRRHGEMLQLVPVSIDDVPDAETVRAIADTVARSDGARWVTLLLEEAT